MFAHRALVPVVLMLALCACEQRVADDGRAPGARDFPAADRPFSQVTGASFGTEEDRDRLGEGKAVMDLAGIEPGMTVADIGAGGGYYTVRLSAQVGPKGRVLAEDIDPQVTEALGTRVMREGLENVSIKLGTGADPSLPPRSFDRIFMVHMYHEVAEPYAFLWRLRPALRPDGKVIVVESDRATGAHGIPPALLFCEMASVGFRLTEFVRKPELQGYYAQFEAVGTRPAPEKITPCRVPGGTRAD
ncbi:class I SAM-dependent methyltransferase [Novosphingobium beihaiensis]|uniref:Class I SAM-dependent methyltransferase n=1 Tax=Novosphingobium beihaiensis TaxID=2930389 RepID=A0ABT0BMU1_9SPHN|nr:class I SAM-dependent methyltransferase [Novosphingobium beihaiensis]MCJ2186168.1 class I SAM-dependent methyltransferase [Novosphingobium beihaiensis]